MIKKLTWVLTLLGALCISTSPAWAQAQVSSSDLKGVVLDPSKSVIPGATVTTTNIATKFSRAAITDENGNYRISLLPPGEYEIKAVAKGFTPQLKQGITLTVGLTAEINFELQLGTVAAEIEVVGGAVPVIENERTHQSTTITQKQVNNLPINGRNFLDFAKLSPGVVEENPAVTFSLLPQIPSSRLSFAGQNGRANTVTIDGVDNNDIASNGVRPTISQEAVQEFQINRSSYNAEFGRASGGAINIVSKSGTNQLHGSFYNYFRNEKLDARNTFATGLPDKPKFKRNQPGFTFGGPIIRDRTFFFGAYEGLFRRESVFVPILQDSSILQPTAGQRDLINTLISTGAPPLVALGQQLSALLTTSPNSPFPGPPVLGNFSPINRLTYNLLTKSTGSFPVLENQSVGSFRLDHSLKQSDQLLFRYNMTNDSRQGQGVTGLLAPSAGLDYGIRDHTFVLGENHIFSSRIFNEFRFQFTRDVFNVGTVDPFGPRINIAGVGNFGRDFTLPSARTQRRFQFLDNFNIISGKNNFKFGGDFNRYSFDVFQPIFLGGSLGFDQNPVPPAVLLGSAVTTQLVTLLSTPVSAGGLGRPDLVPVITQQPLTVIQQTNFGLASSFNQGFGNPNSKLSGHSLGLYAQDSVQVAPTLHLNFGVRYDYEFQPAGVNRDPNNVSPRFGFAYNPSKNGKTVIRGGAGIFYQPLYSATAFAAVVLGRNQQITNILVSPIQSFTPISPTSPCGLALTGAGLPPSFCFVQQLLASGTLTIPSMQTVPEAAWQSLLGLTRATSINKLTQRLDDNAVNPYSLQGSLGIDHQFGQSWNVSVNYLFNHGLKLIRNRQVNAIPNPAVRDPFGRPTLTGRIRPDLLADFSIETAGNSNYHGMTVGVNRRFANHYLLLASYTYGKVIDDATDLNFGQGPQDPTNARGERSLSSFDLRQRFSVSAVLESPIQGGSGSSWYQRALAGFTISPTFTARSGFPFNVTSGANINGEIAIANDRPYAVGRNTGIGPDFFTTDLQVKRRFLFSENSPRAVEVSFDVFNLFNRVNFALVNGNTAGEPTNPNPFLDGVLSLPDGRVLGSSAISATRFRGFTSAFDPRINQLALKFTF